MFTPRRHQLEYMHFHKNSPMLGTKAWHGMGLGKTLTELWLAQEHMEALIKVGVRNPRFLVVLPKSAMMTWKVECHKHTPKLAQFMTLVPYSQLHNIIKSVKYMDIRRIAFDESHNLKSPETERAEKLAAFLREIHRNPGGFKQGRLNLLSGTPMLNNAAELYTSWALCCAPNLDEAATRLLDNKRFTDWRNSFTNTVDMAWTIGKTRPPGQQRRGYAKKHEGVANEEMFYKLINPFVHFRRVSDCIDLPKKLEIHVDLDLPDDKLLRDANIDEPEAYMALVERLSRAKTPHMIDWVKTFIDGNDEQLVVFAMNRHPIEELARHFPKHVRLITGAETGAIRAQNLKDFQDGKYRILAMTYKCGAESLNLQNCKKALYHGWPWTDGMLKQAIARIWRQGQLDVTMHYFLTSGANDSRILGNVRAKEEATTKVENMLLNGGVKVADKILAVDEFI